MNTPSFPRFVWYSTPNSRASGIVSLLAVAETVTCVALYWLLWLKWGVTWHHWLVVAATPLVLMRSEASVKKGVEWFDTYYPAKNWLALTSAKGIAISVISAALALGVAWFLAPNWLTDVAGWPLIWRSAIIGLVSMIVGWAVALAIAGIAIAAGAVKPAVTITVATATAAAIVAAMVGTTTTLGAAATAIAIASMVVVAIVAAAIAAIAIALILAGAAMRVGEIVEATVETTVGITAIVILFVTAIMIAVAGMAALLWVGMGLGVLAAAGVFVAAVVGTVVGGGFWLRAIATRSLATFSHPLAGLQAIPNNWRLLIWHSDLCHPPELIPEHNDTSFSLMVANLTISESWRLNDRLYHFVILIIFFFPALLWRWSIKSTAWFYIPLLWVGRGWQNIHGEDLLIWAKGYSRKWLNITGVLLAAILLIGSFVALIVPGDFFDLQKTLRDAGAPLPVIGWAFVLDWQSLAAQPWQWFYLPSWVLTLMLFFLIDDLGTDIEKGAEAEKRLPALRRWMWVGNARTALTNLGLLIALCYFLDAVNAWGQVTAVFP